MGFEFVRHGRLPYIGSWAHTLPGMAYVHSLSILLFGNSALGFRITDVAFHLGTVWILFLLLRQWISPTAAALSGFLWILYYVSEGYWLAGQPDGFAVFFIALATYIYLGNPDARKHLVRLLAAGAAMGVAILIRPTYGLFLISMLVIGNFIQANQAEDQTRKAFATSFKNSILLVLLGTSLPFVFSLTPYLFIKGGIYQLYEAVIGFNIQVYGGIRDQYNWKGLLLHPYALLALLCLLPRVKSVLAVPKHAKWLAVFYLLSGLASLYVMGKFFVYHFDPVFCLLSVFAAIGIVKIGSYLRIPSLRYAFLGIFLVWALKTFYPRNILHFIRNGMEQKQTGLLQYVYLNLKPNDDFGTRSEESLDSFLSRPGNKQGAIEICSVTPAVRWQSERVEATRFTMIHAYGMHTAGEGFTPFQNSCRKEFIDSLISVRPKFIILANAPTNLPMFANQSPAEIVHGIPGFDQLLSSSYRYDTSIAAYVIYRIKSIGMPTSR